MSDAYIKRWLKAAGIRALRTAAQAALLVLGNDFFNAMAVDWMNVLGFAIGGAVLSVLFSLAGLPEVEPDELEGGAE